MPISSVRSCANYRCINNNIIHLLPIYSISCHRPVVTVELHITRTSQNQSYLIPLFSSIFKHFLLSTMHITNFSHSQQLSTMQSLCWPMHCYLLWYDNKISKSHDISIFLCMQTITQQWLQTWYWGFTCYIHSTWAQTMPWCHEDTMGTAVCTDRHHLGFPPWMDGMG